MRIHLRIDDMALERSLANIAALFDEDAAVTAGPDEAPDAAWTVAVDAADRGGVAFADLLAVVEQGSVHVERYKSDFVHAGLLSRFIRYCSTTTAVRCNFAARYRIKKTEARGARPGTL